MSVTSNGLIFFPLYWRHDDCWTYRSGGINPVIFNHWGHTHFFMLGYSWGLGGGDAFSGRQTFHFELKDIWGPRSTDPNQQFQYRVVGTPKWYFNITELWRRVYIQQWDEHTPVNGTSIVGRKGIKYDASQPHQTFGPFREGANYAPLFIDSARALPVEYYWDDTKDRTKRDNYVKNKYRQASNPGIPYGDGTFFDPPVDGTTPLENLEPGGHASWADGLYIYPTLEYQKVTQLDWERLPGYAAAHDIDSENFGDGWSLDVTIPFTDPTTSQYRSPFGPAPNICMPPGQYFNNLVLTANQLKYRAADNSPPIPPGLGGYDYQNRPFGLSDAQSGKLLQWNDPFGINDGRWVQQCLGGIVQAKAAVTIESKLGGRQDVWVQSTQYLPVDKFAGTDQLLPATTS